MNDKKPVSDKPVRRTQKDAAQVGETHKRLNKKGELPRSTTEQAEKNAHRV